MLAAPPFPVDSLVVPFVRFVHFLNWGCWALTFVVGMCWSSDFVAEQIAAVEIVERVASVAVAAG